MKLTSHALQEELIDIRSPKGTPLKELEWLAGIAIQALRSPRK